MGKIILEKTLEIKCLIEMQGVIHFKPGLTMAHKLIKLIQMVAMISFALAVIEVLLIQRNMLKINVKLATRKPRSMRKTLMCIIKLFSNRDRCKTTMADFNILTHPMATSMTVTLVK